MPAKGLTQKLAANCCSRGLQEHRCPAADDQDAVAAAAPSAAAGCPPPAAATPACVAGGCAWAGGALTARTAESDSAGARDCRLQVARAELLPRADASRLVCLPLLMPVRMRCILFGMPQQRPGMQHIATLTITCMLLCEVVHVQRAHVLLADKRRPAPVEMAAYSALPLLPPLMAAQVMQLAADWVRLQQPAAARWTCLPEKHFRKDVQACAVDPSVRRCQARRRPHQAPTLQPLQAHGSILEPTSAVSMRGRPCGWKCTARSERRVLSAMRGIRPPLPKLLLLPLPTDAGMTVCCL